MATPEGVYGIYKSISPRHHLAEKLAPDGFLHSGPAFLIRRIENAVNEWFFTKNV